MKEVICFVSSQSRLHEFKLAMASVRAHHPTIPIILLYCEPQSTVLSEFLGNEGLTVYHYQKSIDCMGRIEVITLAMQEGYDKIVVLDNDMELFAPLDHIFTLLSSYNAIVTPHNLEPLPVDGRHPSMEDIVHAGNYNAGFFACRASAATKRWLSWWMNQTKIYPELNGPIGHFAEQGWLRFIGDYLEGTLVLRDTRYNVAYWNVTQRGFRKEGETYMTTDGPLVLFHFSGINLERPELMSVHQNRYMAVGELLDLYKQYADKVCHK